MCMHVGENLHQEAIDTGDLVVSLLLGVCLPLLTMMNSSIL